MRRSSLFLFLPPVLFACGDNEPADKAAGDSDTEDTGTEDTGPVWYPDDDHDGYTADVDCDDHNYAMNPGAPEACDGVDNDCDDEVDEGFDVDGDGYVSAEICEETGDDCNDADPEISPAADEVAYDDIDQDCDGADLTDVDGDGFDGGGAGIDCDDGDASVHPGAEEIAKDDIDQDCDDADLLDGDGDGYDDADLGGDDCDDDAPSVNPGALDWHNDGEDTDCDGRDGQTLDLSDAPVIISSTGSNNDYLGNGIDVCDLDDDGFDDLVISASLYGASYPGAVMVFSGDGSAAWDSGLVAEDADIFIDGGSGYFMGFGVGCADVDGDGALDIVTARGSFGSMSGYDFTTNFELLIFYGDGSWSPELEDADAGAVLGYDLGPDANTGQVYSRAYQLADLDGDGASEIIVAMNTGENSDETPQLGDSSLWVIPGAAHGGELDMSEQVSVKVSYDGEDVLSDYEAVDWDGDGALELFWSQGVLADETSGEALYPGSVGFIEVPSAAGAIADLASVGAVGSGDDQFGYTAAFGDFDGDGSLDGLFAAVGQDYGGSADAGAIHLVSDLAVAFTDVGLVAEDLVSASTLGQHPDGLLGYRMHSVGDANGDGTDDVLVWEPAGGASGTGRVRLINGGSLDGFNVNPDDAQLLVFKPESSADEAGSIMGAGDFDADGVPDFVIGAPSYRSGSAYVGRVYVYLSGGL